MQLDWSFAGDGAVGEDIGNLVPDSVFDLFVPAARLPELEQAAVTGYLAGLADAGWDGDTDAVRLAIWASAIKYDWLTPWMLERAAQQQVDYGGDRPVDAARRYRERGATLAFLAVWAQRARALAERRPELLR